MVSKEYSSLYIDQINTDYSTSAQSPLYMANIGGALENLLSKSNNEPKPGSLEGIFADKAKTQKASAKALLDDIKLRENLNSKLLGRIDYEITKQNTQILEIENRRESYFFDNFLELKKLKLKIEDTVLELEREKRKECIECWRDLMFMKKYLLSSLKDYWNIARKRDVLSLDFSGFNHNEIQTGYQSTV